ncbi:hypothetical protein AGIG_G16642 [Arapaima gigas]
MPQPSLILIVDVSSALTFFNHSSVILESLGSKLGEIHHCLFEQFISTDNAIIICYVNISKEAGHLIVAYKSRICCPDLRQETCCHHE